MVTLLFDNLVQFDVDGQLRPGLADALGVRPRTAGATPFTCVAARRSTTAGRSAPGEVRASIPPRPRARGRKAARQWPCCPSTARADYAAGRDGTSAESRCPMTPPSSSPWPTRSTVSAVPGDAGRRRGADAGAAGFDQQPVGSGPLAVRRLDSRRCHPARPERPTWWGGAPLEDTLRCASSPRRSPRAPSTRPASS